MRNNIYKLLPGTYFLYYEFVFLAGNLIFLSLQLYILQVKFVILIVQFLFKMEIKHPKIEDAGVNKQEKGNLSNFVERIKCIDPVDNRKTCCPKMNHNPVYEQYQNKIIYHGYPPEKFLFFWVYQQLRNY